MSGGGGDARAARGARGAACSCCCSRAPPLLASMVVGFVVGLFQAATQIQDQTLAFVPKLVVVHARAGRRWGRCWERRWCASRRRCCWRSRRCADGRVTCAADRLGIVIADGPGGGAPRARDLVGRRRSAARGCPRRRASASRCCWRWSPRRRWRAGGRRGALAQASRRSRSRCCSGARSSSASAWAWSRRRCFAPPRSAGGSPTPCAGANVAEILVPTAEERASPLGVLYLLLATLVFLHIGGVPRLVEALLSSYRALPVGGGLGARGRPAARRWWSGAASAKLIAAGAGAGGAGRRRALADRPRPGPHRAGRAAVPVYFLGLPLKGLLRSASCSSGWDCYKTPSQAVF